MARFVAFCHECRIELSWKNPIERMLWVAAHTEDFPGHLPGNGRSVSTRNLTNN